MKMRVMEGALKRYERRMEAALAHQQRLGKRATDIYDTIKNHGYILSDAGKHNQMYEEVDVSDAWRPLWPTSSDSLSRPRARCPMRTTSCAPFRLQTGAQGVSLPAPEHDIQGLGGALCGTPGNTTKLCEPHGP